MEMDMEKFWNGVERRKLKHMEKALSVTLCAPQILHGPAWGCTQVFTVDNSPANRLSLHKDRRSPSPYLER
jgi:hypothetical protein